jgi:hypothetical protein
MRRALLLTGVALFVVTSMALAASYRTGRYEAGAQSGFKAPGVRIDIHHGSFNVERILMHETCTATGHPAIHDFGGFQQGTSARLQGTIKASGALAGIWRDGHGGYTKVTGQISGADLMLTGREVSRYRPSGSSFTYSCQATGSFHPKRV